MDEISYIYLNCKIKVRRSRGEKNLYFSYTWNVNSSRGIFHLSFWIRCQWVLEGVHDNVRYYKDAWQKIHCLLQETSTKKRNCFFQMIILPLRVLLSLSFGMLLYFLIFMSWCDFNRNEGNKHKNASIMQVAMEQMGPAFTMKLLW